MKKKEGKRKGKGLDHKKVVVVVTPKSKQTSLITKKKREKDRKKENLAIFDEFLCDSEE